MSRRKPNRRSAPRGDKAARRGWASGLDSDVFAVLAVFAVWLIAAVMIDPRGDFPLNDDWCYWTSVSDLIRHRGLHIVGIVPMTLAAQVLWGALFCKFLGLTFTALRLSTLALGLAGLLATYGLLREARTHRWIAVFGCLVVGLNPLYLSLSYSFMTDVPFAAVALVAIYLYVRALRLDSIGLMILATGMACAATLIRQLGIILPIGFAVGYLVKNGLRARTIITAVLPIIAVQAVLTGYVHWLKVAHLLPAFYNIQAGQTKQFLALGPGAWIMAALEIARVSWIYLGCFLLPFLILTFSQKWQALTIGQRRVNSLISMLFAVVVTFTLIQEGRWMPLCRSPGDYITDFGLGPPTLRDVFVAQIGNRQTAPESFWLIVTLAGVIGGALLLWHLLAAMESLWGSRVSPFQKGFRVMLMAVTAMYVAPMVVLTAFRYFDRYLLCAVPLMIAVAALTTDQHPGIGRVRLAGALIALVLIGAFGIGGTHDYLAWNRLRWQAANDIVREQHAKPSDIDGGYEYNGWHNYEENNPEQNWWRTVHDHYMISFGPMRGYHELKKYTYHRWMPPGEGDIYVLSK